MLCYVPGSVFFFGGFPRDTKPTFYFLGYIRKKNKKKTDRQCRCYLDFSVFTSKNMTETDRIFGEKPEDRRSHF